MPVPATAFDIIIGAEYIYVSAHPKKCMGFRYKVLGLIRSVPSYAQEVLVEALTGPDKGMYFTCSPWNFATRYRPAPEHITRANAPGAQESGNLATPQT